jgi:endonuclease/exonuclease/phosphatase family metal-dependent hydrolase
LNLLRYTLLVANTALAVLVILACMAPYISPETNWMPGILSLFFPYLAFGLLFFAFIWLLSSRPWWSLLSAVALIPGMVHMPGYFQVGSTPELMEKSHIWLASYNIQDFQLLRGQNKQKATDIKKEIASYLLQHGTPDILCVQDYSTDHEAFIKKYLKLKNKQIFSKQRVKTGIFTRFPIVRDGEIRFEDSYNSCVWADVKVGEDTIRVYSIHLESNKITSDTEEVLTQEEIDEEVLVKKVRTMMRKYKNSASQRVQQSEQIAGHIESAPYPVLVCGDLNDIPLSRAYRIIKGDRKDSFRAKGKGFGTTYAGGIPGLRIDYIFVSDYWSVLQHEVLSDKAFSDHYAIMARLKMKKE